MFVGCQTRSLPTANPSVNTKKAPAKAGAFLGCEIQSLDLPRRDLRLGLIFPLANLLLVDIAHERSHDVEVVALLQFFGHVFREAIPNDDAMPFGFFVALLVRTRPPGFRGEREDGERASRLLCGFAFGALSQKAHEFDSIFVHFLNLHFLPL